MTAFDPVADATARWDGALESIPDRDAWIARTLAGQVDAGQVTPAGRPRCTVARPYLTDRERIDADQRVVTAVTAALVAAGELLLSDAALGAEYLGHEWTAGPAAEAVRLPAGLPESLVTGRLDGVAGPDGLIAFELNAGMPGGMADTDAAAAMMAAWPAYAATGAVHRLTAPRLVDDCLAAILTAWADGGGSGSPLTVLAMPDELAATAGAHLPGLAAAAGRADLEFVVADPGRLRREGSTLRLDGRRVDLVLRGFYSTMVEYLGDRLTGLLGAVAAGDVPLVSPLRAGVYGHKACFAVATDPATDLDLDPGVRELATAHLPWTRLARAGRTGGPDGGTVDLADYVVADRERLVLKPATGFGGAGVVLGWETEPQHWHSEWARALATGGFVVQRRVPMPTTSYPRLAPGMPRVSLTVDHNPVLGNRRVLGYFTRVSEHGMTNMTTGAGSLVPTFLVGPHPDTGRLR